MAAVGAVRGCQGVCGGVWGGRRYSAPVHKGHFSLPQHYIDMECVHRKWPVCACVCPSTEVGLEQALGDIFRICFPLIGDLPYENEEVKAKMFIHKNCLYQQS